MTRSHPQAFVAHGTPSAPKVVTSIRDLRQAVAAAREAAAGDATATTSNGSSLRAPRIALIPTMGALHAGHLSLVEAAAALADVVVISIFVNPLQFGPSEDLARYPKTLPADVAALTGTRADIVFAPSVAQMYPHGSATTRVSAGPVGGLYEGSSRPGHFDGVLTVVNKLLNIVGPDVVMFGQKDAQQVHLVSQMAHDLNLPVVVQAAPTVREGDGLALSSRNRFLSPTAHTAALALSSALRIATSAAENGVGLMREAALAALSDEPLVRLDYLEVVHPDTFLSVDDDYRGPALVLVAALVDSTRLIDNQAVVIGPNPQGEPPV